MAPPEILLVFGGPYVAGFLLVGLMPGWRSLAIAFGIGGILLVSVGMAATAQGTGFGGAILLLMVVLAAAGLTAGTVTRLVGLFWPGISRVAAGAVWGVGLLAGPIYVIGNYSA